MLALRVLAGHDGGPLAQSKLLGLHERDVLLAGDLGLILVQPTDASGSLSEQLGVLDAIGRELALQLTLRGIMPSSARASAVVVQFISSISSAR